MLCLSFSQQGLGQITIVEDFDYGNSAGNLAGQNGGSGFAGAWGGGAGGYTPTGLSFGAMSSPGGAHNSAGFFRQITTGFAASGPVSGSFLFQMTSPSSSVQMLGLGTSGSWNNQNHYIGLMPANDGQAGKPALGIRGTGISAMTGGASLTQGTTYMYAFSYDNGSTSAWILSLSQYINFFNGTTLDQTAMNAAPIGTGSTNITGKVTIATSASNLATMNYIYTYWFGGGSMTVDRIRMSGTAALMNLEPALAGAALNFDGVNDDVIIPHASNITFNTNEDFTISLHVKIPSTNQPNGVNIDNSILEKIGVGGYPYVIRYYNHTSGAGTNGKVVAARWNGSTAAVVTSTVTLNDDNWHHVAFVKSGATLYLYVDGVLNSTAADLTSGPTTNTGPLTIGSRTSASNWFKGDVDNLRIWNVARSCEEIRQLRNCELTGSEPNLVAYYNFNQGFANENNSGVTTLTDAAGGDNNGTLNNFALSGATSNWVSPGGVTTGTSCPAVTAPEVNLQGGSPLASITDGDATPSTTDCTDFGTVATSSPFARSFTIQNTGTSALTVSSIAVTGTNNSEFVVSGITLPATVTAANSTTFTVTFTPTATSARTATITVNNTDCDEAVYDFAVTGTGAAPGAGLDLSGASDYVSLAGTNSLLDGATQFTIEHWIKSNGTGGIGIVGKGASGCCINTIHSGLNPGGVFFLKVGNNDGLITGAGVVPTGTWIHLAAVYNGSASAPSDRIKIYANGVLQPASMFGSIPATAPSPNVPFAIGSALSDGIHNYNGQIDEVRIWNTARTCDQISQLRNCELVGTESGLMAYYKFNQGVASGTNTGTTTLTDLAGGDNNGTLNSFTLTGATSNWVTPGGVTTGTSCPAVVAPEADVQGGSPLTSINDGDSTPSTTDNTDFGNVAVNGNLARTFTIFNTGNAALTITSITSSSARYTISGVPSSVAAGSSATFTVTYSPLVRGAVNATITVNNGDCDEAMYDFAVTGTGTGAVTYTFSGTTNTDWATASNWSTGVVPTTGNLASGDAVVVDAACTITNTTVTFASGTSLMVNASRTLTFSGTSAFTLSSGATGTIAGTLSMGVPGGTSLTISSGATLTLNASANLSQGRTVNNGTMDLYGSYSAYYMTNNSGANMNVKSGGSYSCPACAESFVAGSFVTNDGTLHLGTASTWQCTLTNNSTGIITDGGNGAQIALGASSVTHNYGSYVSRTSSTAGTFTNYGSGTLSMPATCLFTVSGSGSLSNAGTISVPSSSALNIQASASLTNTGTVNNNGTVATTGTFTNNGLYKGSGSYTTTTFTNAASGNVSPGASPGCQTFGSGYTNVGTLTIEANGITACTQYDRLNVTGTATLGGTLTVTSGYSPANGDILTIINATAISGTFATVNLPSNWFLNYNLPAAGQVSLSYNAPLVAAAALAFDGSNDYVEVPNSASLNNYASTGEITIEYWIKPAFSAPSQHIIARRNAGNSAGFIFEHNGALVNHWFNTSAGWQKVDFAYTNNVWQHIAITAKIGGSMIVYKDGVQVATAGLGGTSFTSLPNNVLRLMANTFGAATAFAPGSLDEVRIWSRALSSCEILARKDCELPAGQTGLVAYYRFNQGIANGNNTAITTLTDASGNNNHGTLTNFALTSGNSTSNWISPGGVTTGTSCPAANAYPEADLLSHNNTPLADGTTSTSVAQGTNLGSVSFGSSSDSKNFTIQNNGTAALNVTSIVSSDPQFAVTALTPVSPIPAGMSATFTITFTPTATGVQNATITINNNDCDEGVYDFAVTGTGVCIPPSFSACPTGPLTANTVTGTCAAPVSYTVTAAGNPAPTVTYAFTGATTGTGSGTGSGSAFNKGNTTVTVTATSTCSPAATCSFTVTVTDTEKPQITCAGTVNINTTAGLCTGTTTLTAPNVTDNCPLGGNGLNFDGSNDQVATATYSGTALTGDLTMECWFKGTSLNGRALIGRGYQQEFDLALWSNQLTYYHGDGSAYEEVNFNYVFTDNTWYHVAVVRNTSAQTLSLYVNGVFQQTLAYGTPLPVAQTAAFRIGNRAAGQSFLGSIDEVRVWTVARTPAQIAGNWNKELVAQSGLFALYHLNEGVANASNAGVTTAADASGNAKDGTLTNFALSGTTSNWGIGAFGGVTNNAPATYPKGNTTVTWTVTDASGNTETCEQTVTVTDNEVPVLTVPAANIPLNVIATTCAANYTIVDPIADNCTGSTWSYALSGATTLATVSGIADGTGSGAISFNKGVTTVTLNGVDEATNVAVQKTFTVTVTDNIAPTIACAASVDINTTPGLCTGTTTLTAPTVTDNCISTGNSLNFDGVDDYVLTPNVSIANTGLTVEAWIRPTTFTGYARIAEQSYLSSFYFGSTSGANGLSVWLNNLERATTSGGTITTGVWQHVAFTYDAGASQVKIYINGTLMVTTSYSGAVSANLPIYIGRHNNGGALFTGTMDEVRIWNSARTQAQIQANMNNELNAQTGLLAAYHFNQGTAGGTNTGVTSATDASGNGYNGTLNNFALTGTTSNWGIGAFGGVTNNAPVTYPKGNTTVIWTATDAAGNTATCAQTVTVNDNEIPVLTVPAANIPLNVIATTCAANYTITDPIADNCTGSTWTYALSGATTAATSSAINDGANATNVSFNKGVTMVTLNGVDAATNAAVQKTFTVTVTDNEKPTISGCATNQSINVITGTCAANYAIPAPTLMDNCAGPLTWNAGFSGNPINPTNLTGLANGSPSGNVSFNKGTTTVTLTATDAAHNTSTANCTFTVTVADNIPPTITCASNVTINNTPGLCTGTTTLNAPTVSDNCSSLLGNALDFNGTPNYATLPSGVYFNGQFTIECWVYPKSYSNWSRIIDFGNGAGSNNVLLGYTFGTSGKPGLYIEGTQIQSTATLPLNQWSHVAATFSGGNGTIYVNGVASGSGSFPTPANVTRTLNYIGRSNWGQGDPDANAIFDELRIWDVARTQAQIQSTMSIELTGNETGLQIYFPFNQGVACGNNTSIMQILDMAPAGGTTNGTLNSFTLNGGCTNNFTTGASAPILITNNAPSVYPKGNTTVTWTATDASGNTETCNQTVTVTDNEKPTITGCATNQSINVITGTCAANYAIPAPTLADNCAGPLTWNATFSGNAIGNPTNLTNQTSGVASANVSFSKGATTVTLSATDAANNTSTANCSFTVTVVDNIAPTITCPSTASVNTATGQCSNSATWTTPTPTDNCSGATIQSVSHASGSTFSVGTTTVTYTVIDAANNTNACVFDVVVSDNQLPQITCPDNISTIGTSAAGAVVSFANATATDNCTAVILSQIGGLASGSTFPLGVTEVTFRASDTAGNTSECSFTVTISGLPPLITCPGNMTVTQCDPVANFAATETVGVPASVITYSQNPGTAFALGTNTVTATATNAVGTSACTFTVTVLPYIGMFEGVYYCDQALLEAAIANSITVNPTATVSLELFPGAYPMGTCLIVGQNTHITTMGAVTISCLEMDTSTPMQTLTLMGNVQVGELRLTEGCIRTNGHNLRANTLMGGGPNSFVITD